MKSFKLNLCIFFATTMMLYSCQKENPASVSNSNSNEKEMVNLDEPPIVDTICVENDDEVCSSIGQGSGGFVPTHAIPNAVVQLFQDPDYGDYYYFGSETKYFRTKKSDFGSGKGGTEVEENGP